MADKTWFGRLRDRITDFIQPARPAPAPAPTSARPESESEELRRLIRQLEREIPRPQQPVLPPKPELTDEQKFRVEHGYHPEPIARPEAEQPGTSERPKDSNGDPVKVWLVDKPERSTDYDRTDVRKHWQRQSSALKYADDIGVPTKVFKDETGKWRVVIDYPKVKKVK